MTLAVGLDCVKRVRGFHRALVLTSCECDDRVNTYAEKWALIWLCSVACCDEMKQSCFAVNIPESEDGSECKNLATLEYFPF